MIILLPVLCGLVWGALAALLNSFITRRALEKDTNSALLTGNFLRLLVDFTALGLIFLLRGVLPFDYTWMMIAAAIALSIGTIFISFRIAREKQ